MGAIRGAREFKKFEEGKHLTRREAILAQCYECNGLDESNVDCTGYKCPLYEYHPHKGKKRVLQSEIVGFGLSQVNRKGSLKQKEEDI